MNKDQLHEKAVQFVLSTYLSDWNSDLPFCRILEGVAENDWEIMTPWEPFESMDSQELANNIADSVSYFMTLFKDEVK